MTFLTPVGLQRRVALLVGLGLFVVFGLFSYFGWQAVQAAAMGCITFTISPF